MPTAIRRTPVILITGFLGAGKTTFINWFLEHTAETTNISLILNEFGDIKLESEFITKKKGEIVELANGCMCCVAQKDIPHIATYILDTAPQTEYILIEASGLSDPDPIVEVFDQDALATRTYIAGVVGIADCSHFQETVDSHPLVLSQLADSDIVVLSKIQDVSPETVAAVTKHIHTIMPDMRVFPFDSRLTPEIFISLSPHQSEHGHEDEHDHHHVHEDFSTKWITRRRFADVSSLQDVLLKLPRRIVRVKGYANVDGEKILVNMLGRRITYTPSEWDGKEPDTRLLTITLREKT